MIFLFLILFTLNTFILNQKQKLMDSVFNPETILKSIIDQELTHRKNGEYTEAQDCRLKYLKQRDDLCNKALHDMNTRHKNEINAMKNNWNDELNSYNAECDGNMEKMKQEHSNQKQQLQEKHDKNYQNTKQSLERTLPFKVKESSELLNLRKMEEHLAKQKNYVEAKKVQSKIASMVSTQKYSWDTHRKQKLDNALNSLKATQKVEMDSVDQKLANIRAEKVKERKVKVDEINMKYENFMNDLKNKQKKEVLMFKGEFTSLGGGSSKVEESRAISGFRTH